MSVASIQQAIERGLELQKAGRLTEAEAIYRQILAQHPNQPEALYLLGAIAYQVGRLDVASDLVNRAIGINSSIASYHSMLGIIRLTQRQFDAAADAFATALRLEPNRAEVRFNLANSFLMMQRFNEAIEQYRLVLQARPDAAMAYVNLGMALAGLEQHGQAITAYRKATELEPDQVDAHYNLANSLQRTGQIDSAIDEYRTTIRLKPDHVGAQMNLGESLKETGQLDEAIDCFHQAMKIAPADSRPHSNLLLAMQSHWKFDAETIYQEHLNWRRVHADPLKAQIRPHPNDRNPTRRLRIGYVSPDFREHSIALFMLPLMANHDRSQVEVFCYADVPHPDAFTARLQKHADTWRNIAGLSDEMVAQIVRNDRIDILVDLTLHSAWNRLLVFARKPAPVQVSYLSYPGTTGLDAIDYRLTDPHLDPPNNGDQFYSERSVHLPRTYWCYSPDPASPEVNPLPALSAGYVTFASMNRLSKVTPPTWETWIELLKAIPKSRLIVFARQGRHRGRILDLFKHGGVDPIRIEIVDHVPMRGYLERYHQIDIMLDPFPHNGGTTTCDALWMGVPVVSLVGQRAISRAGLNLLTNVGLPQLVAQDPEQYIRIATELADDLPRLTQLRSSLRPMMQASPLCDAKSFARDVESAYRVMWGRWCGVEP